MRQTPIWFERIDQNLKRNPVVGVPFRTDPADSPEKIAKGRIPGQVCAEWERIHKKPDQFMRLGRISPGDGHPDHQVVLLRVPEQESVESGEKRHEGRRALILASFSREDFSEDGKRSDSRLP